MVNGVPPQIESGIFTVTETFGEITIVLMFLVRPSIGESGKSAGKNRALIILPSNDLISQSPAWAKVKSPSAISVIFIIVLLYFYYCNLFFFIIDRFIVIYFFNLYQLAIYNDKKHHRSQPHKDNCHRYQRQQLM